MSKTRKILSVVLAVVLVFALSVPAFANWEAEDNGYTQTWALGTPVATANTDEYTIDVSLTTDYATGALEFELEFTGDVVLTGVQLGAGYYEDADVQKNLTSGKVALIPDTAGANTLEATEIDGVVATLTVTGTNGTVAIKEDVKSETNQGGTLIATRVEPADLVLGTQYVGQELVTVGDAVSIGSIPADLAVKAGAPAGIVIDKNKTFGGAYAGVVYGFEPDSYNTALNANFYTSKLEATNGGTISVPGVKVGRVSVFGTGSTIVVKNSDGSVSKTYVVVIFGDIDGDGKINTNDMQAIYKHVNAGGDTSLMLANEIVFMAANTQVATGRNDAVKATSLHTVNANKITEIFKAVNGDGTSLNQAALAASHALYNTFYQ